jgi:CO dehydrogenase nickel-insertion accessory protein CooC1
VTAQQPLAGQRLGLFGKGGAGKSTVAVLLARALRQRGYGVCVLDADSTNLGLPQALGIEPAPAPLLDYFGGMIFSGGLVTFPVDDPTPLAGADLALDELPPPYASRGPDEIVLLTAGKIGALGPGAGCDGPIAKIARDLRVRFGDQPPVTLVDFKAGFEDSARGAITSLDWALVVVDPTTASLELAAHMRNLIERVQAGFLPATRHLSQPDLVALANRLFREAPIQGVHIVLNRVRDSAVEAYLREKLAEQGLQPIGTLPEEPAIQTAWLKGNRLADMALSDSLRSIVAALEAAETRVRPALAFAPGG